MIAARDSSGRSSQKQCPAGSRTSSAAPGMRSAISREFSHEMVRELAGLDEATRYKIMQGNARRVFDLPEPQDGSWASSKTS